jgi:hypothetical protein
MPDIKGAFRVTKNEFIDIHYTVLLLSDALVFVRTGGELSGPDVNAIEESDLQRYRGMSREELVRLHKKNFDVPFEDIINIKLKKSTYSINGPRTGVFTIVGKKTTNFNISRFQNFGAIEKMVRSVMPDKSGYEIAPASLNSASNPEAYPSSEAPISGIHTAENQPGIELSRNERTVQNYATWLFIIAALSIVNFVVFLVGGDIHFVVGLAITEFIAAVTRATGTTLIIGAVITTVIFSGIFAACGIYGRQGKAWAFILGIVVYLLDTLLFLVVRDWLSIVFHIFVLYILLMGARAAWKSKKPQMDTISS